jgi:cbb3-type cytochrome oxidase subunit 3
MRDREESEQRFWDAVFLTALGACFVGYLVLAFSGWLPGGGA